MNTAQVSITSPGSFSSAVQVNTLGIAKFHTCQIGTLEVQVESDGFIKANEAIEVGCQHEDFTIERLVSLSPKLKAGETRIIMSWGTESPRDVDIHVVSVKKSDQSTCRTYYDNQNGCTEIIQDVDNRKGGNSGAETVTLLDNSINKEYTYLIGIEDYKYGLSGQTNFTQSEAKITITNGVETEVLRMVANSITLPNEYEKFIES